MTRFLSDLAAERVRIERKHAMIGKMLSVRVAVDRVLEILSDDGVTALVDLAPLIATRANLAPLADPDEFAQVRLSGDGWSVEWPSGIDFGAPQLRLWAIERSHADAGV